MRTTGSQARAVERVERLCREPSDSRELRVAVLDEVRASVPFDAFAWVVTDPETQVGSAPLADVPCLPELPRLIRLKYLTELNRWTALEGPAATLCGVTDGAPERSLVFRELLGDLGVTDVASVVFRDRFGCWGFLDLWRIGAPPFDDAEVAFLSAVSGPVTAALRRSLAATFSLTAPAPPTGPGVLVLSPDLAVRAQTPETDRYLRALLPPDADQRPIPAAAYNVAAQLLAAEAGVDDRPAWARVHIPGGAWVTLRAARMEPTADAAAADIAVTIDACSPAERVSLLARTCGLTQRETELLDLLVGGADTRAISDAMFLSRHTVQDHLKSIFAKTGTRNRRTLLACALGP